MICRKEKRPCTLCEHYYDQFEKFKPPTIPKKEEIFCKKCGKHKNEFIFSFERMEKNIRFGYMTEDEIYYVFKHEARRCFHKFYDRCRYESGNMEEDDE